MNVEACTCDLVECVPNVQKRCWSNIKHSVVIEDGDEVEASLHFFCGLEQAKKRRIRCNDSTKNLTWVGVSVVKVFRTWI